MRVLDRVQQGMAPRLASTVTTHRLLLVALLGAALFSRFWRLGTPADFYFDEVYFPQTGREILQGDPAAWEFYGHENTHPPLSKLFMAGGMAFFGEDNPFGWRFFGAVAGVGAVVFIYLLGRRLFRSEGVGLLAAFLLTFEGLAFTQARIGTPDAYLLFFILGAIYFLIADRWLLSGLFFGAATATKLTALFTAIPMALYLVYRYRQEQRGRGAMLLYLAPLSLLGFYLGTPALFGEWLVTQPRPGALVPALSAPMFRAALAVWMAAWALAPLAIYAAYRVYRSRWVRGEDDAGTVASSLIGLSLFFILVPLYVYFLSYLPMLLNGYGIGDVWELNRLAYQFHSTLDATHPYQAPWNTWPILMRPVFFFVEGRAKIYNLGNPVIFWLGLPALAFALWRGLRGVRARLDPKTGDVAIWGSIRPEQAGPLFVALTYIAFWLPWAVQPRIMFLYHYLPALAFLILALAYALYCLGQRSWERLSPWIAYPAVAVAAGAAVAGLAGQWLAATTNIPDWQLTWSRPFLVIGAVSLLIFGLGHLASRAFRQPWGRTVAVGALAVVALTFIYFYPHLAAVSVSAELDDSYFWFPSWR